LFPDAGNRFHRNFDFNFLRPIRAAPCARTKS
jgi:hypothetical protein